MKTKILLLSLLFSTIANSLTLKEFENFAQAKINELKGNQYTPTLAADLGFQFISDLNPGGNYGKHQRKFFKQLKRQKKDIFSIKNILEALDQSFQDNNVIPQRWRNLTDMYDSDSEPAVRRRAKKSAVTTSFAAHKTTASLLCQRSKTSS